MGIRVGSTRIGDFMCSFGIYGHNQFANHWFHSECHLLTKPSIEKIQCEIVLVLRHGHEWSRSLWDLDSHCSFDQLGINFKICLNDIYGRYLKRLFVITFGLFLDLLHLGKYSFGSKTEISFDSLLW